MRTISMLAFFSLFGCVNNNNKNLAPKLERDSITVSWNYTTHNIQSESIIREKIIFNDSIIIKYYFKKFTETGILSIYKNSISYNKTFLKLLKERTYVINEKEFIVKKFYYDATYGFLNLFICNNNIILMKVAQNNNIVIFETSNVPNNLKDMILKDDEFINTEW